MKSKKRGQNKKKNLEGKRFGKLIVIEWAGMKQLKTQGNASWLCQCDCGERKIILELNLLSGRSESCGCEVGWNIYKHGLHSTHFYREWYYLKQSCEDNPWESFEEFLIDLFEKYEKHEKKHPRKKLYLVRKNRWLPLSRENATWGWKQEGNRFLTSGHKITYRGVTASKAGWGFRLGITRERVRQLHDEGRLESYIDKKWDSLKNPELINE